MSFAPLITSKGEMKKHHAERVRSYCMSCGGQFIPDSSRRVTCSSECARARTSVLRVFCDVRGLKVRPDPRPCAQCGKDYRPRTTHKSCAYCSRTCTRMAAYARQHDLSTPVACRRCETMFVRNHRNRAYCKPSCKQAADDAKRGRNPSPDAPRMKDAPVVGPFGPTRKCEVCKQQYHPRSATQRICRAEVCLKAFRARSMRESRVRIKQGPPVAKPAAATLPCTACAHWKPMTGADLGGYCEVGRFVLCKPYTPGAKPYAPRPVSDAG